MIQRIPLIAAVSAELFSVGIAVGFLAHNDWFGSGDLTAMVFWSLPLALLVYFGFTGILRSFQLSPAARHLTLTLVGAFLGFVTMAFAVMILGPAIAAFSFPVFICWVVAGASAGFAAAVLSSPSRWLVGAVPVVLVWYALIQLSHFASAPEVQILVALQPGLSASDEQRFWTDVIGTPGLHGTGHGMLDGISAASAAGHEKGAALFVVSLQRRVDAQRAESIISLIRRSPLVRSAQLVAL